MNEWFFREISIFRFYTIFFDYISRILATRSATLHWRLCVDCIYLPFLLTWLLLICRCTGAMPFAAVVVAVAVSTPPCHLLRSTTFENSRVNTAQQQQAGRKMLCQHSNNYNSSWYNNETGSPKNPAHNKLPKLLPHVFCNFSQFFFNLQFVILFICFNFFVLTSYCIYLYIFTPFAVICCYSHICCFVFTIRKHLICGFVCVLLLFTLSHAAAHMLPECDCDKY